MEITTWTVPKLLRTLSEPKNQNQRKEPGLGPSWPGAGPMFKTWSPKHTTWSEMDAGSIRATILSIN